MADEATEAPQTSQAPETAEPSGVTEAPEQTGAGAGTEATEATPPDISESVRQMNAAIQDLSSRIPAQPEVDPIDRLLGQDDDYEDEPAAPAQAQAPAPEGEDGELLSEFRALMREEIQGQVMPYFQHQEETRRAEAIRGLDAKYNGDLKEHATEIANTLDGLAERYGNPHLRTDPELVERTYLALKAQAAAGAESPAAAVAGGGAVLEQGASPGVPEPEDDPIQKQYESVFANLSQGSGL